MPLARPALYVGFERQSGELDGTQRISSCTVETNGIGTWSTADTWVTHSDCGCAVPTPPRT
ncbi:hypothetical protein [Streptomyces cadmiisoli]|uniref:Uncharacterized protein n=1 Tax=Streptomyces cadmiisoli TaxID=2184053 RepID=A0A2Z4JAF9_9ACTN|nr:hypothetical protein [Streptomyces cadmiisoli]AWW41688.1 hypothetical protein DN051_37775 [Streptomyces cadmiisoli]